MHAEGEIEDVAGVVDAEGPLAGDERVGLVDEVVVAESDGAGFFVDVEGGREGGVFAATAVV